MMRSRMWGGIRCCRASVKRPGRGVAMATRTQSSIETSMPAMATASSEMVMAVWWRRAWTSVAEVGDGLDAVENDGGQQEGQDGERCDRDQQHVDGAGEALAAAAVGAVGEVLVVVRAHGRREAGDVVAPSGEDVSDDGIGALGRRHAARSGRAGEKIYHSVIDNILLDLIAGGGQKVADGWMDAATDAPGSARVGRIGASGQLLITKRLG